MVCTIEKAHRADDPGLPFLLFIVNHAEPVLIPQRQDEVGERLVIYAAP